MVVLAGRDIIVDDDDFWWSRTGQIIKWSIIVGIFVVLILYMSLGYTHAKRRIRRGLPPLAYHRWLLSKEQRAQFDASHHGPAPAYGVYGPDRYGMHAFPPPIYDPNAPPPPAYQPAAGVTKTDPSQRSKPTRRPASAEGYAPPPGPPPASTLSSNHMGSSSTSNNPYRS